MIISIRTIVQCACLATALPAVVLEAQESRFVLDRTHAIQVPSNFEVGGLFVGEGPRVLAWSLVAPELLIVKDRKVARIVFPGTEAAASAGFVTGTQAASVLLPASRRILTLAADGQIVRSTSIRGIDSTREFVASRFSGARWAIAVRDKAGNCEIFLLDSTGNARQFAVLSKARYGRLLPDSNAKFSIHLGWYDGHIVVTTLWAPFVSLVLSRNGTIERTFRPTPERDFPQVPDALWASLPAMPIDKGWLQELTNLRGDERVLIRYDVAGAVQKGRSFLGALGLVASHVRTRTIVGTFRTNEVALLLYSWHWQ